jgi:hypothetical protein
MAVGNHSWHLASALKGARVVAGCVVIVLVVVVATTVVVVVEVVDTADNFMGGNDSFVSSLTAELHEDNANRAIIIRFIVLPFS